MEKSENIKMEYTSKFSNEKTILLFDLPKGSQYWWKTETEIAEKLLGRSITVNIDVDIAEEIAENYPQKQIYLITQIEHFKTQHPYLYSLVSFLWDMHGKKRKIKIKERKMNDSITFMTFICECGEQVYTIGVMADIINNNAIIEEIMTKIGETRLRELLKEKGVNKDIEKVGSDTRYLFLADESNVTKSISNYYNINEWLAFIEITSKSLERLAFSSIE